MTNIEKRDEDIDVLHVGSLTERRIKIINDLAAAGLRVHYLFGVYGKKRDDWIARSKIVINCHFYTAKTFELVRCSHLFANRRFVVSEYGDDKNLEEPYYDAAAFADYDNIVSTCIKYLANETERLKIADRGYEIFSKRLQSYFLKPLLTV